MTVPERLGKRRWEPGRPGLVLGGLLVLAAAPAASISLALSQALGIL
jgi:hypothetical protein